MKLLITLLLLIGFVGCSTSDIKVDIDKRIETKGLKRY
jgi:hypothetical protein